MGQLKEFGPVPPATSVYDPHVVGDASRGADRPKRNKRTRCMIDVRAAIETATRCPQAKGRIVMIDVRQRPGNSGSFAGNKVA